MDQIVLEDLQKMNSLHPDSVEAVTLYQMALEMSDRGNHDLALEILNIVFTLAPKFGAAFREMGTWYEQPGQCPGNIKI